VGITLIIPMAVTWLRTGEWIDLDLEWRQIFHEGIPLRPLARGLLTFSPVLTFLVWKFSYLGLAFDYIEANYFGRGFLQFGYAFYAWTEAFKSMLEVQILNIVHITSPNSWVWRLGSRPVLRRSNLTPKLRGSALQSC
jgi:hypothetical protein